MRLEPVIGLEVHAQLLTRSKMFCGCSRDYSGAEPNTFLCPVCLGMPGTLPVINRKAVEYVVMTGLALNCSINEHTKFDRKNYHYPDLMKGYQISQFDLPIAYKGWLELPDGKRAGITRVHLEEDTARLLHRTDPASGEGYSLMDVNRSGTPLMEIVGEPDLKSPEEARQYLIKLRAIVQYLGVSTASMEEGSFRCDANISMAIDGRMQPSKVEVKNMNSFRSVYNALVYEIERQTKVLESGGRVEQETRGWVEARGVTVSQRSKEHAHDYRYFPEPDLPPLVLDREFVEEVRSRLPELPDQRRARFQEAYGLAVYDATQLTVSKPTADFFEEAVRASNLLDGKLTARAKATANWTITELARLLNTQNKDIADSPVTPTALSGMLDMLDSGAISTKIAKDVFEEMYRTGKDARQVVREKGFAQISDDDQIRTIVDQVVVANPQAVADFKKGKENAVKFLVGQVMKASKGQANPKKANLLVTERLGRE
jgi:aspartyl-tRNA(Asn)/glutamyl-tRNA(Gln) amidotransferase subunit B